MHVKYYGNGPASGSTIALLYLANPYRNKPESPSYCVWIVPGTIDVDGNPID